MNGQPANISERDIGQRIFIFSWGKRFFQWFFSWRIIRRILIILAWVVTVVALFYAEENFRGRRAWNRYRAQLEARGEQLDLKAFIPAPVQDEDNFAAVPFVRNWFDPELRRDQKQIWNDDYVPISSKVDPRRNDEHASRQFLDLVAWANAFEAFKNGRFDSFRYSPGSLTLDARSNAAPAVLESLKTSATNLAQLRLGSQRPHARYPIVYDLDNPWAILLPHLAQIRAASQRLELRACAELAAHQNDKALDDLKLMFSLADTVKEEPFLVSYLVRLACFHLAIQTLWEGLTEHAWSDAQLQEIQARLQQYDFLADLQRPLGAEKAGAILTVDLLIRGRFQLETLTSGSPGASEPPLPEWLLSHVAPRGWFYQEQVNYCRLDNLQMGGIFDAAKKQVSPARVEANRREMERDIFPGGLRPLFQHHVIARLLLPALLDTVRKTAQAQTAANQAALACAIERYRLANGVLPEKVDLLSPALINSPPNDVVTGKPYNYRREENGFVLYSVGWNENDDGGRPGKTLFDEKQGDWVWR
jgi:hypothetical protein